MTWQLKCQFRAYHAYSTPQALQHCRGILYTHKSVSNKTVGLHQRLDAGSQPKHHVFEHAYSVPKSAKPWLQHLHSSLITPADSNTHKWLLHCNITLPSKTPLLPQLQHSDLTPEEHPVVPHTRHWGVLWSLLSLLTPNWTSCRDNRRMFKKGNCFSKQLKMLKQTTDTPDISGKIAHPSNGFLWLYGWNLILFEEMHCTDLAPTSLCKKMRK